MDAGSQLIRADSGTNQLPFGLSAVDSVSSAGGVRTECYRVTSLVPLTYLDGRLLNGGKFPPFSCSSGNELVVVGFDFLWISGWRY